MATGQKTNLEPGKLADTLLNDFVKLRKNPPISSFKKRSKSPADVVAASTNASMTARTSYIDTLIHSIPALKVVFEPICLDLTCKTLADRSTEEIIDLIESGRFIWEIGQSWSVTLSTLTKWIKADEDRLAWVNLARRNQAALWDWVALQVLVHAPSDRTELIRAEKIAQHCRWRAKAFNRDDYGENIKVTQVDKRNVRELTTRELEIIARGAVLPS